ncbi:unnamed protein product, partial [Symbiodinium sp. CCMP2456]
MDEPCLKKRRLQAIGTAKVSVSDWIQAQLQDLDFSEQVINAVKESLRGYTRAALLEASVENLKKALPDSCDRPTRVAVAQSLHNRIHQLSTQAP